SAYLDPANSNLQVAVEVRDPNNVVIGTAVPANGNRETYLNSAPALISGIYTFNVSGVGSSTGDYWLWVRLNTASEVETDGPPAGDDTVATAQNLSSGFSSLAGAPSKVQQAAVLGIADGSIGGALAPDYYAIPMA